MNGSLVLHIDPGPGALIACHEFGQDPMKTDLLLVTHNHIDHVNDAGVIAEAMSSHALKKKGWLIGSKSVILGDENGDKGISNYHKKSLAHVLAAKPGKRISIAIKGRRAELFPTKVKHDDRTGFGFVLEMDGSRLGFTSDTEYFEGISGQFNRCDVLIAHNLKSREGGAPGHLFTAGTIRLFREAAPRLGVISHMGMRLIKSGPEKEAQKIAEASGIRTIAARDGMRIDVSSLNIRMLKAKVKSLKPIM